ncbi:glutathione S-transferase 1 [Folsomia candida]|uniref:glutathione transferase n=1 Tax=Folsomia candida TaxID=158441 RepID=A0A226EAN8_FOLCA|nr:glutathione S-transferase 1 [Folsomia candida]OXA54214.1 Glutathione S-transferase 1 [Folsomia candida]
MSASETYKLTYFDFRGLAEPIRLMFAFAGVDYIDERVPQDASWPEKKATLPWGTMPVLEVRPGKSGPSFVLAQVAAIGRYLAKKFNLDAKTEEDAAKCDEYVDALKDFAQEFIIWYRSTDEVAKSAQLLELKEKHGPNYFGKFEAIISKSESGWLVGPSLTWTDIFAANHLSNWAKFLGDENTDLLKDKYPNLSKLVEKVFSLEGISKWIKERPETPF